MKYRPPPSPTGSTNHRPRPPGGRRLPRAAVSPRLAASGARQCCLLPPWCFAACPDVELAGEPTCRRWRIRHGRPVAPCRSHPKKGVHAWVGDAEPEAQSPGCRVSGPWAAPPLVLEDAGTARGRVAARLRRATHGAAAWRHVGAHVADTREHRLLQLIMDLVMGKQQQVQAPVVGSQMNKLVLGVNISSHIQFKSSKGNTLND